MAKTSEHQVLDPCLLGRPVHLLPQFAAQFGADLAAAMRAPGARRYWDGFELESVDFARAPEPEQVSRWLGFACAGGTLAFSIGRQVVLGLLNQRYGRRGAAPAALPDPDTVRVTATEERLEVFIGQQIAAQLAARVGANCVRARAEPVAAPDAAVESRALPGRAPPKGSWTIRVGLRRAQSGERGQYWLALDQAMVAAVLQGLQPQRPRPRAAPPSLAPLTATLQLQLDARLVSKEITLETLFAMRLGDIIPVSLGRAEVLLAESRLFTAAVSEHNGNLCLTAFKDAD